LKIYLAARYERRLELLPIHRKLDDAGHDITSTWISGEHDNTAPAEAARVDLNDIDLADAIILLSENGRDSHSRGGRHFECGYAYAQGKQIIILGQREGVFHYLSEVMVFDTVEEIIEALK
jgi:nucleoside 2-deoxyribosyltransferase